ncbi:MAG: T9SS type A sorting domain-containing protein [Bacteroidetes bacterium]|jgi:hypothetical protein|nr:T9SS type A sorting domain-containing protein [Bacteroidota bacterium]
MKPIHIVYSLVLFSFTLAPLSADAQQSGLAWLRLLGSSGIEHSPGFVAHANGDYYLALTFSAPLLLPGSTDTLSPQGSEDGLLARYNAQGALVSAVQMASKGHVSITDLVLHNNKLVLSGGFQDSLILIADGSQQLALFTDHYLNGYLLEFNADIELIRAVNPMDDAVYATVNHLSSSSGGLFATAYMQSDTSSQINNVMLEWNDQQINLSQLKPAGMHKILGVSPYRHTDKVFYGTYRDTLVYGQDTLIAKAGTDACLGVLDQLDQPVALLGFESYQNAEAIAAARYLDHLWVAVNFSDTLFLPNQDTIVSAGSNDLLIAGFDSLMNLNHQFRITGVFAEYADELFVQGNEMFVFSNVASPVIRIYHNDTLQLEVNQSNMHGNAALFSINDMLQSSFVWITQHDWSSSITGLHKLNSTETIISGVFTDELVIDSLQFDAVGNSDVFFLRVSDACISKFKSQYLTIPFCEGDSVYLPHLTKNDQGGYFFDPELEQGVYITQPTGIVLENRLECGCLASDSIVFLFAGDAQQSQLTINRKSQIYLANTQIELTVDYCGECMIQHMLSAEISPNPFKHKSNLNISVSEAGVLSYVLFTSLGVPISQVIEKRIETGTYHFELPLHTQPPGTYLVKVLFAGEEHSLQREIKLIKQ